jgi:hypothetical protein
VDAVATAAGENERAPERLHRLMALAALALKALASSFVKLPQFLLPKLNRPCVGLSDNVERTQRILAHL